MSLLLSLVLLSASVCSWKKPSPSEEPSLLALCLINPMNLRTHKA